MFFKREDLKLFVIQMKIYKLKSLGLKSITGVYSKNIRMILKEDQLWAKKGFEVAYGQEIKVEKENQTHSEYEFLKVVEGDGNIGVFINDTEVLFAKDKGLVSLVYQKNEMLIERPQPVFLESSY